MSEEVKEYNFDQDFEALSQWLGDKVAEASPEEPPVKKSKGKKTDDAVKQDKKSAVSKEEASKSEKKSAKEEKKTAEEGEQTAAKKTKKSKEKIDTEKDIDVKVGIAKAKVVTEVEKAAELLRQKKLKEAEEKRRLQEDSDAEYYSEEDEDYFPQEECCPPQPCEQVIHIPCNTPLVTIYLSR